MATVIQERLYTADDLWELSHNSEDGTRYELDEGVLIEMSPAGDTHGELAAWILYLLMAYVVANDLGIITAAETGYTLQKDPAIVNAPDVGFLSKARLTARTGKYYSVAPDLAVEVVSPNDKAREVRRKVNKYLQFGTRLVWVVYPEDRLIDVYRPNHDPLSIEIAGVLDGYDVLPGLSLPVREVFARMRE